MIRTDAERLVQISVMGQVVSPSYPNIPAVPHVIARDGTPRLVPMWGGIVYNVRVGMPALGWVGENIEPGVAIRHPEAGPNHALNVYACVGNEATVMSGRAAGARGVVTGKSGRFAEHVIIDFPPDVVEQLAIGDKIQVRAHGVGLSFADFPAIRTKSLSPRLFEALAPRTTPDGKLEVPVVGTVPAELVGAGSGLGSEGGSISIQTSDPQMLADAGLGDLRLGDLVALADYDSAFGHGYRRGAIAVGVVCHADSYRAGYGPGLTILMTARDGSLTTRQDRRANLAEILHVGTGRELAAARG